MPATSLIVEVSATVKVRQSINMVDLFAQMNERDRERYRTFDPAEVGAEASWERPTAFLWPEDDDLIPFQMVSGAPGAVRGDIDDARIQLSKRGDEPVYGRDSDWSETDFETLIAKVPWLRTFHASLDQPVSAYDLARIPGPDDLPLF